MQDINDLSILLPQRIVKHVEDGTGRKDKKDVIEGLSLLITRLGHAILDNPPNVEGWLRKALCEDVAEFASMIFTKTYPRIY